MKFKKIYMILFYQTIDFLIMQCVRMQFCSVKIYQNPVILEIIELPLICSIILCTLWSWKNTVHITVEILWLLVHKYDILIYNISLESWGNYFLSGFHRITLNITDYYYYYYYHHHHHHQDKCDDRLYKKDASLNSWRTWI
jgi:hypothetical protein